MYGRSQRPKPGRDPTLQTSGQAGLWQALHRQVSEHLAMLLEQFLQGQAKGAPPEFLSPGEWALMAGAALNVTAAGSPGAGQNVAMLPTPQDTGRPSPPPDTPHPVLGRPVPSILQPAPSRTTDRLPARTRAPDPETRRESGPPARRWSAPPSGSPAQTAHEPAVSSTASDSSHDLNQRALRGWLESLPEAHYQQRTRAQAPVSPNPGASPAPRLAGDLRQVTSLAELCSHRGRERGT